MTFPEWITFHNLDVVAALLIVAAVAYVAHKVTDAVRVVREARDERSVRRELYTEPPLEARGTVIEVERLLDRLRPLDPPSGGMVHRDGFRSA